MAVEQFQELNAATSQVSKGADKGEAFEKLAFNFCKAATIMLLAAPLRQFALPVVTAIAACLYLLAYLNGQRGTRCILGKPLVVAAFWGAVSLVAWFLALRPLLLN
ncbi:MAG TPA: hypothetical protein VF600_09345 [Abditibacteriaceae bacterium]|jgi:hypothetical protein